MTKQLQQGTVRIAQRYVFSMTGIASVAAATLFPAAQGAAQAQVIATPTGAGTTVTGSGAQFNIAGGTQAGGNLFHEFEQFDLGEAQTANFASDSSVFNIVGQISEAAPSYIDGTVQVLNSDANLYLINPSGVLFGPNAQLSLNGSLTATSADQVKFDDHVLNALEQTQDYKTLTGDPSELHFTTESAGAVVNQGDLAVPAGESILLAGGTVVNTGSLQAPGGEIGLVAVGGNSTVRLAAPGSLLSMEVIANELSRDLDGAFNPVDLPKILTGGAVLGADSFVINAEGSITLTSAEALQNTEVTVTSGSAVVSGELTAASEAGDGGTVALLGQSVSVVGAQVNASGDHGGSIRVGGGLRGDGLLPTSAHTVVAANSALHADGAVGAGGDIVVWANDTATVRGGLSAKGATDGGLVETSAPYLSTHGADVQVSGPAAGGTWLVDPVNFEVVASGASINQINASTIESVIDGGNNYVVSTAGMGAEDGDISLQASIHQTDTASRGELQFVGRRFEDNGHKINLASAGQLTFDINAINTDPNPDSRSLQNAIEAIGNVNGRRLIRLGEANYSVDQRIFLNTDVEIEGTNPLTTILSTSTPNVRIFRVDFDTDVTLRNLTLTTLGLQPGEQGGGVFNRGTLTVENSAFTNNRALQNGGAIDSFEGGSVTVLDSTFSNNTSGEDGGGGAIHLGELLGTSRISNTLFENNTALVNGGAVTVTNSALIVEGGTRFIRNTASKNGGSIYLNNSQADISDTLISRNATGLSGGGIAAAFGTTLTVNDNSTISRNTAGDEGGGLYVFDWSTATIDAVEISNNSAGGGGGGGYIGANSQATLTDVNVNANTASVGGGLRSHNSDVVVQSTLVPDSTIVAGRIISNSAIRQSQSGDSDDSMVAYGGGVAQSGGSLRLSNIKLSRNRSEGGGGGLAMEGDATAIANENTEFSRNTAVTNGGAIALSETSDLTITNNFVNRNTAEGAGGGLFSNTAAAVTIHETLFLGNEASTNGGALSLGGGGTTTLQTFSLTENTAKENGGAVHFRHDSGNLVMDSASILANRAEGVGGAIANFSDTAAFILTNASLDDNSAGAEGGALYTQANSVSSITAAGVNRNRSGVDTNGDTIASSNGGALYITSESGFAVNRVGIVENAATGQGGAIYYDGDQPLSVSNTRVQGNTAQSNGGAIAIDSANNTLVIESSSFQDNIAERNGGGVSVGDRSSVTATNSSFTQNQASTSGGGIHNAPNGTLAVSSSTFEQNESASGGAIANSGNSHIVNTTFSGNIASNQGGAISNSNNAQLQLSSSTITNNRAANQSGGIETTGTTARLQNTIVAGNSSVVSADVRGSFTDAGNNLIGQGEGATGFNNSLLVGNAANPIDPRLADLANNGGPTKTHRLLADSLAIDSGAPSHRLTTDQRGQQRPSGTAADIGSVELSEAERPERSSGNSITAGLPLDPTLSAPNADRKGSLLAIRTEQSLSESNASVRRLERIFSQSFEDYWDLSASPDIAFSDVQAILRRAQEEYKVNSAVIYAIFTPKEPAVEEPTTAAAAAATILHMDPTPHNDDLLSLSIVLPAGELVRYQLPVTRQEALRQVRYFRSAVSDEYDARGYLPLAQQMYQWLLAPIEADLAAQNIQNLMYALDSGLRTTPITAMHDYDGFALERYGISVVPSIGLMQADFPAAVRRSTVAMGVSEFDAQLPLPAVPIELAVVEQFVPVSQTALNESTTLDTLKDVQALEQPGILHLATHASFDRRSPEDSLIHLWDKPLDMKEFSRLNWDNSDLEMLILSACSTALGSRNSELGFAGLAAAAGVDATVGSLWDVSDVGTLALMSEFYAQLETTDLRFEALRRAQLGLLNGDTRIENGNLLTGHGEIELPDDWNMPASATLDHPYFWSAFTMVGNPW